ncbi:MAG TPA: hypothetical protein VGM53_11420 [Streptosporangiaceae bacterium]
MHSSSGNRLVLADPLTGPGAVPPADPVALPRAGLGVDLLPGPDAVPLAGPTGDRSLSRSLFRAATRSRAAGSSAARVSRPVSRNTAE